MVKKFKYKGITFTPYEKLRGRAANFDVKTKRSRDIGITPKGWSWEDFYKKAKPAGGEKYDIFLMETKGKDKIKVIPSSNYLWMYVD